MNDKEQDILAEVGKGLAGKDEAEQRFAAAIAAAYAAGKAAGKK